MDIYLRMRTVLFFRFFTWTWTVLKIKSSFSPELLYKQLLKYELLLLHLKLVPRFLSVTQMDLRPCKKKTQSSVSQQRCGSAESQDNKMTTFRISILADTTSQKAKCHMWHTEEMETQKRNKTLDLYNPLIYGCKNTRQLHCSTSLLDVYGEEQSSWEQSTVRLLLSALCHPFPRATPRKQRCIASCRAHSVEILFSCCVCLWGNKETSEQLEQVVRVLKFICQEFLELAGGTLFNANYFRTICPTLPAEDKWPRVTQTCTMQRTLVLTTIKAGSQLSIALIYFYSFKKKGNPNTWWLQTGQCHKCTAEQKPVLDRLHSQQHFLQGVCMMF